jgi:hypothetical protein
MRFAPSTYTKPELLTSGLRTLRSRPQCREPFGNPPGDLYRPDGGEATHPTTT